MHTFFINTSEKDILSNKDILDIEEINRDLILLNYPLNRWKEKESGYTGCAGKIGELIDNYREINNDFNLVIYVDLAAISEYSSVFENNDNNLKTVCLYAFYSVIHNYIKKTLIAELTDHAREPLETIVILEEAERKKVSLKLDINEKKELLIDQIGKIIGFPSSDQLNKILTDHFDELFRQRDEINELKDDVQKIEKRINVSITNDMVDLLISQLNTASHSAVFKEQFEYYEDKLRYMLARIVDNVCIKELREEFLMSIYYSYKNEKLSNDGFYFTSFITDRKAIGRNLTESLKRNLRIYFYLTSCIRSHTFIEPADANGEPLAHPENGAIKNYRAKDIAMIDRNHWYLIRDYLFEKNRIYKRKLELTFKMRESYSSLGLAPVLDEFDNERFSLDPYGAGTEEDVERLIDKETLEEFDYDGLAIVREMKNKPKINGRKAEIMAQEYINAANKLKTLHMTYLERLQEHVMNTLSGYAKSDENCPPVLSKRVVNIDTNVIDEERTVCRYKKADSVGNTKKSVISEKNAANSYHTIQNLYFEFCASRELAVSDISEQCDWLEERMKQIQESLNKAKKVGTTSLAVTLLAFIPYIFVGWTTITSSMLSFFTALCSLAVPCALFVGIFSAIVAWQKSKLKKTWNEFWNKHLKALEENKASAAHYDRLLTAYIPALRYIYEYYLDVQFRKECEQLAESKISHHIQFLQDRVKLTDKLLSDLQLGIQSDNVNLSDKDYTVDFHRTYCTGKNNIELYSIIDDEAIKLIYGGENKS